MMGDCLLSVARQAGSGVTLTRLGVVGGSGRDAEDALTTRREVGMVGLQTAPQLFSFDCATLPTLTCELSNFPPLPPANTNLYSDPRALRRVASK